MEPKWTESKYHGIHAVTASYSIGIHQARMTYFNFDVFLWHAFIFTGSELLGWEYSLAQAQEASVREIEAKMRREE